MRVIIVWVTTKFEAFHRWVNAPDDVAFLRSYHRHLFHVKVGMEVTHLNRNIEFFQFKEKLNIFLAENYESQQMEKSCEMIANEILLQFDASFVEISEDGENGAIVSNEIVT